MGVAELSRELVAGSLSPQALSSRILATSRAEVKRSMQHPVNNNHCLHATCWGWLLHLCCCLRLDKNVTACKQGAELHPNGWVNVKLYTHTRMITMRSMLIRLAAGTVLAFAALQAHANDIEGVIESVDADARTLTVQGITFETTDRTDYDDGLKLFDDLRVGQKVEVDFDYVDGRHIATEIELED
ncbi:MAG: DUF1344 domain-containing protein [Pseudomonadaceae bacterium]|nr:MAG: DUF1344 domain-containing protein [Pseudomonadaceae bacterium]